MRQIQETNLILIKLFISLKTKGNIKIYMFYGKLIQMYYQKQNPFRKSTIFENLYPQKRFVQILNNNNTTNNSTNISPRQSRIDNPFQKSNYEQIFNRKNYQSQNKDLHDDNRYRGTFLPLTRYQARMRLKQLDTQLWKRQKQQEQRYKLEHFGPDALRYTSYSTPHNTFVSKLALNDQNNKYAPKKSINKQYQRFQDKKRQVLDETPRSQYMVYVNQQRPKQRFNNKFTESTTSISQNNGNPYKKFNSHYQNRNNYKHSLNEFNESVNARIQYDNRPKIMNDYQFNLNVPSSTEMLDNQQSGYFKNPNTKTQQFKQYNQISQAIYLKLNEKNLGNQQRLSDSIFKNHLQQDEVVNSNNFNKMSAGSNFSYERPLKNQRKNSYTSDYIDEEGQREQRHGPLDPMKFSSSQSSDSPYSNTRELRPSRFANNQQPRWSQSIYYEGREFYRINI